MPERVNRNIGRIKGRETQSSSLHSSREKPGVIRSLPGLSSRLDKKRLIVTSLDAGRSELASKRNRDRNRSAEDLLHACSFLRGWHHQPWVRSIVLEITDA